jgi:hypothetical protein
MNLRKIKQLAEKLGATVENTKCGATHECRVEAPKGKLWAEGNVHELVDAAYLPWKPDYIDLLSRMNYGLEDCNNPECEWCNGE